MIQPIARTAALANLGLQTNDTAACVLLVSPVNIVNLVRNFNSKQRQVLKHLSLSLILLSFFIFRVL